MHQNEASYIQWWRQHRDTFHGILRDLDKARTARDVKVKDEHIQRASLRMLGIFQELCPPAGWMWADGQPSSTLSA